MTPARPLIDELDPAPEPYTLARSFSHLPCLLFLDSAGGPSPLARYSYLCADPLGWLQIRGPDAENPFEVVRRCLSDWRIERTPGLPPFQGGAAGLFGYGLAHWLERLPRPR